MNAETLPLVLELAPIMETIAMVFAVVAVLHGIVFMFHTAVRNFRESRAPFDTWETREHVDELYAWHMNERHKAGQTLVSFTEFIQERGIDYESLPVK